MAEQEACHTGVENPSEKRVFKIERSMLKIALATFLFLLASEVIAYFGFFQTIPNFAAKYSYYLFFLVVSVVINALAVWHIKAYQHTYSHMSGMMIGMTIGMTTGFSIGLILGATNGMFIGSVAGLVIGMIVGGYAGNCCGIMGLMEGMMAGLMGGLMGAMTSVMTLNDHLKIFIPILLASETIILVCLLYMVYAHELKDRSEVHYKGFDFLPFMTVTFIIALALTFLIVYGPRSFLFN